MTLTNLHVSALAILTVFVGLLRLSGTPLAAAVGAAALLFGVVAGKASRLVSPDYGGHFRIAGSQL